jgi:hypothetical protein
MMCHAIHMETTVDQAVQEVADEARAVLAVLARGLGLPDTEGLALQVQDPTTLVVTGFIDQYATDELTEELTLRARQAYVTKALEGALGAQGYRVAFAFDPTGGGVLALRGRDDATDRTVEAVVDRSGKVIVDYLDAAFPETVWVPEFEALVAALRRLGIEGNVVSATFGQTEENAERARQAARRGQLA